MCNATLNHARGGHFIGGLTSQTKYAYPTIHSARCLQSLAERLERLCADIVFDAFSIETCGFSTYAKRQQEIFYSPVAGSALIGNFTTFLRQKNSAIWFARNQTFGRQSGEHLGHGRLRDAQARSNIDLTRFIAVFNKVSDKLNIVFHERRAAGRPRLAEAFGVAVGIDKWLVTRNGLT
jgi:hypothetical protein